MRYRLRKSLATRRFCHLTQAAMKTPPMPVVPGTATFFSTVANQDLQVYRVEPHGHVGIAAEAPHEPLPIADSTGRPSRNSTSRGPACCPNAGMKGTPSNPPRTTPSPTNPAAVCCPVRNAGTSTAAPTRRRTTSSTSSGPTALTATASPNWGSASSANCKPHERRHG